METIAQKELKSQEKLVKPIQRNAEEYGERIDPQEFWEEIDRRVREGIRITLEKTISREFSHPRGHWNMREAQEEKMFAMGIALGILARSMG